MSSSPQAAMKTKAFSPQISPCVWKPAWAPSFMTETKNKRKKLSILPSGMDNLTKLLNRKEIL